MGNQCTMKSAFLDAFRACGRKSPNGCSASKENLQRLACVNLFIFSSLVVKCRAGVSKVQDNRRVSLPGRCH